MKNLTIILLLLSIGVFSQERQIISFGVDPELIRVGGYPNDNDLLNDATVLHAHFSWLTSLEKWEAGTRVSYANLQPYKYFDMGFLYNRKIKLFKSEVIETLLGAEIGLIIRQYPLYETQKAYFDYGLNGQIRFWITDNIGWYFKGNFGPRNDLNYYGSHQAIHFDGETGILIRF